MSTTISSTEEGSPRQSLQTLGDLLQNNTNIPSISDLPASCGITLLPPPPINDTTTTNDGKNNDIDVALSSVKDVLASLGVISGAKDPEKVQRPIPTNLFQPPKYHPSLTTLMPRSRLPPGAKVRGGSAKSDTTNTVDEDELVEVWVYSLTNDGNENGGGRCEME